MESSTFIIIIYVILTPLPFKSEPTPSELRTPTITPDINP